MTTTAENLQPPFPVRLGGRVIKGFGRGGKELGIPTANIPVDGLKVDGRDVLESGIYYGWAGLENATERRGSFAEKAKLLTAKIAGPLGSVAFGSTDDDGVGAGSHGHGKVYPMVMSVGWNPYYKNTVRSMEVHIIHQFEYDFYDRQLNIVVMGYLRPEKDYDSKEALIADIQGDIEAAGINLSKPENAKFAKDKHLTTFNAAPTTTLFPDTAATTTAATNTAPAPSTST